MNKEKQRASLYCDGACRGNPGPAGIGAVLLLKEEGKCLELSEYIGSATNNVAEYKALLLGLKKALGKNGLEKNDLGKNELERNKLGKNELEKKAADIDIYLDSELIVRQLSGQYRVRDAKMKPLYLEAHALLRQLNSYTIQHIPREKNTKADRLANRAIDLAL